jgi:hypothetical protein
MDVLRLLRAKHNPTSEKAPVCLQGQIVKVHGISWVILNPEELEPAIWG